jgi:hypothetical protein
MTQLEAIELQDAASQERERAESLMALARQLLDRGGMSRESPRCALCSAPIRESQGHMVDPAGRHFHVQGPPRPDRPAS